MVRAAFDWKRFWCPRGERPALRDRGFLLDPESDYAKYFQPQAVPFEVIATTPCLVLLGEPGSGKSTALHHEWQTVKGALEASRDFALWFDLREYGTDARLCQRVFESPQVDKWRRGSNNLHIFFDSLDECLLRIDNIAEVLRSELRDMPISRLRLRIACRPADWPESLEQSLKELWADQQIGIFELTPLRRRDIVTAAETIGVDDPEAFLAEIDRLDAASLANRPVTLNFLLGAFQRRKSLPNSQSALYVEGCTRLCEETSQSRRGAQRPGSLTACQRLAIAGRLAAVTQFSNRFAIWTGTRGEEMPVEDVLIDDLVGGTEGTGSDTVQVDTHAIRETLNTGLFSSRGLNRLGWSHQTYAEYLAAHYLSQHAVPAEQMVKLLLHADGSGKTVPQLRETAAWLASFEIAVFQRLVKSDPATLLRSDVANATDADRAALGNSLLHAYDTGELWEHDGGLRSFYERLNNRELPGIVKSFAMDTSKNPEARRAAIAIAQACNLNLDTDLVDLALNPDENLHVRIRAANAIAQAGSDVAKAALKPLVMGNVGDDPDDDLKGCGLFAAWPEYLTATDLFTALTPRKKHTYIGLYSRFLDSDIASSLRSAEDLLVALSWAKRHCGTDTVLHEESKLAASIVARAMADLGNDQIANAVAEALIHRWEQHQKPGAAIQTLLESEPTRRRLTAAVLPLLTSNTHAAFMLMQVCAISCRDISWLLPELVNAHSLEAQRVLSQVIAWGLDPSDVDTFDSVVIAANTNPVLATAIRPRIEAIDPNSAFAAELRHYFQLDQENEKARTATSPAPDAGVIQGILDTGTPEAFPLVCLEVEKYLPWDGCKEWAWWTHLDDALKARILGAAHTYVRDFCPANETRWWKGAEFPYYAVAAYWALALLAQEAPNRFSALGADAWARWAPVVAWYPFRSAQEGHEDVIKTAYRQAPIQILTTLEDIVEADNERYGNIFALDRFDHIWDEQVAKRLRKTMISGTLKHDAFDTVLAKLLEHHDPAALALAETMLREPLPTEPTPRDDAASAACQLLVHDSIRSWSLVWPLVQVDEEFGESVLRRVAREPKGSRALALFSDEQLADIYLWLSPRVGPWVPVSGFVTPAQEQSRWCDSLPRILADRGTVGSCRAIRRIIAARPDLKVMNWYLKSAEEAARRNTWLPTTPAEMIRIASDASARLVRNAHELMEVLIESLSRLQVLLQGETPAAIDLWSDMGKRRTATGNELRGLFRPKDEAALSNYIKRHLDRDLNERGVIVNREVEIRASTGGAPGERTDIHVNIAVATTEPGVMEKVTVIIEVKGCWNRDLNHAMETQLRDRYLGDNECRHGLYVVGWFMCRQWDFKDRRRQDTPSVSVQDAERQFAAQAARLSTGETTLRAFVLNTALR